MDRIVSLENQLRAFNKHRDAARTFTFKAPAQGRETSDCVDEPQNYSRSSSQPRYTGEAELHAGSLNERAAPLVFN